MIDPITTIRPPMTSHSAGITEKDRNIGTEEQVASAYYASSIQSLSPVLPAPQEAQKSASKIEASSDKKSIFRRIKDWFQGVFGVTSKQQAHVEAPAETIESSPRSVDDNIPRLAPPEILESQHLAAAAEELNRFYKDAAEFETEISEPTGGSREQLMFFQILYAALRQEKLKEDESMGRQQDILLKHQSNKALQQKYYNLLEENQRHQKYANILKWTNAAATSATIATLGLSIFLSGGLGALGAAPAIATILKGVTTGSSGILQHKMDKESGEAGVIQLDVKKTSQKVDHGLTDLQGFDREIANLYKLIREFLKNQSQAARASFNKS